MNESSDKTVTVNTTITYTCPDGAKQTVRCKLMNRYLLLGLQVIRDCNIIIAGADLGFLEVSVVVVVVGLWCGGLVAPRHQEDFN